MRDILSGLCKIHERNFIHRDLKPENILINVINEDERMSMGEQFKPRYIAKIADFGLSAEIKYGIFSGKNHIDDRMGTLLYMAPEQAQGKVYGKRVDIWALGIIMYTMLTGHHPFFKPDDTEYSYSNRMSN
jgi:serine/threonine protein kinase